MESEGVTIAVYEILSILFQITSIFFNGAIICTLRKKSLFKCPSNKFVFSLCLSQLLVSILSFMISVTQSFITGPQPLRVGRVVHHHPLSSTGPDGHYPILTSSSGIDELGSNGNIGSYHHIQNGSTTGGRTSSILSHLQLYATFMVSIGSSLTIALISVDRYITIALPMKYKGIVTPTRCTLVISLAWLVAALITIAPTILIFGNDTSIYGPIAIPNGALGLYFAIVFSIVTSVVLSVMISCYNRIFKIAKEKCQKVQIGHFTSPVSSISSDWPSSVCSSHNNEGQRHALPFNQSESAVVLPQSPSQIRCSRTNSNPSSLLQYILLANLEKQANINSSDGHRESFLETDATPKCVTLPTPGTPRSRPRSASPRLTPPPPPIVSPPTIRYSPHRLGGVRKWKTFLQHNYNSPRKTVSTIFMLIGSLTLTQLPLTLALYSTDLSPTVFYFAFKILIGISTISSPILYGFLNRSIRLSLWKFLRIRKRYRTKDFKQIGSKTFDSRKASVSSSGSCQFYNNTPGRNNMSQHFEDLRSNLTSYLSSNHNNDVRVRLEEEVVESGGESGRISKNFEMKEVKFYRIDEEDDKMNVDSYINNTKDEIQTSLLLLKEEEEEDRNRVNEDEEDDQSSLSSSFPRKPSQDSGADVTFTDDEDEEIKNITKEESQESSMRVRGGIPSRSPLILEDADGTDNNGVLTKSVLTVALSQDFHYADEDDEIDDESEYDDDDDELFDFDEDEHFERMRIIKKKFSLTDEDIDSIRSLEYLNDESVIEIGEQPIDV